MDFLMPNSRSPNVAITLERTLNLSLTVPLSEKFAVA